MKKRLIPAAYLSISLLGVFSAQGQDSKLATFAGSKIITTIENTSHPVTVGGDSGTSGNQQAGPGKTEKATWETTFIKKTSGPVMVSKKLKRIIFSVKGPVGLEKYDSDNSFESTDGAENWVKKFVQVLDKPSGRTLTDPASAGNQKSVAVSKTDNVWDSDLPDYDPSSYWNGLAIELPTNLKAEKNTEWNTAFVLDYGSVQNEFTIVEVTKDTLKVKIKSKMIFNGADKGSLNANGGPPGISLGLQKKEKTFDGIVSVDAHSMLILSGAFQIETVSVLNVNGSGSEQRSYSTTVISNSVGK